MKHVALTIAVLALGLAACDSKDEFDGVPDSNDVVVNEDETRPADECPRADGTPCL